LIDVQVESSLDSYGIRNARVGARKAYDQTWEGQPMSSDCQPAMTLILIQQPLIQQSRHGSRAVEIEL